MVTAVKVEQTVQEWGNGLGVRIPAPVARAARFTQGLPITVGVVEGGVLLRAAGKTKLTLAQKPRGFRPEAARWRGDGHLDPRLTRLRRGADSTEAE